MDKAVFFTVLLLCGLITSYGNQLKIQLQERENKSSSCYGSLDNSITHGRCKDSERAVVFSVIAGVKNSTRYTTNNNTGYIECQPWGNDKCCEKEEEDCFGEYQIYVGSGADPYIFHTVCIGKQECVRLPTAHMDTANLNCSNINEYPRQTGYLDIKYYCVDTKRIKSMSGTLEVTNSWLYLWGGMGNNHNYTELPATTLNCSVETDCGHTIQVVSVDFRFAKNDTNLTCIPDNKLTIIDGNQTKDFNCTANNHFVIQELYVSESNYIIISYTGVHSGGYLWLRLLASSDVLRVNCQPVPKHFDCGPIAINESESVNTTLLIAVIICAVVLLLGCFVLMYYKKKKQREEAGQNPGKNNLSVISDGVPQFAAKPFMTNNLPPRHGQLDPLCSNENQKKRKKKKKKSKANDDGNNENGSIERHTDNKVHPTQLKPEGAFITNDQSTKMNEEVKKKKHHDFEENIIQEEYYDNDNA